MLLCMFSLITPFFIRLYPVKKGGRKGGRNWLQQINLQTRL